MGREVKRVALNFSWPVGRTWSGFLMPKELAPDDCPHCEYGSSAESKALKDKWYGYAPFRPEDRGSVPLTVDHPGVRAFAERNCRNTPTFYGSNETSIVREASRLCSLWNAQWAHHLNQDDVDALIDAGRLVDLTHRWSGKKWVATGHRPTAQEVNDWSLNGFGHDSINQWTVTRAECARHGWPTACAFCDGEGAVYRDDAHRAEHDGWTPTEPPEGFGYQMWENTSEGSPISPVFASAHDLATWLTNTGASALGDETATYEQWMRAIDRGWSPSAVSFGGQLVSGVVGL